MYFRISMSKTRESRKQVLLKAPCMKIAKDMAHDVEKMLFPNEKCETFIRKVDIKKELSHTEAYYEFTVVADFKSDDKADENEIEGFCTVLKAENEDEAWEKAEKLFEDEGAQVIRIEAVSAKELLDEEINQIKHRLAYEKYPNETVRSFYELMQDEEKTAELMYDMIVEKRRKENLTKRIKAEIDLNKITALELESSMELLLSCSEEQQLQSLQNEIIAKYGKR